jgi:hypothetical protein
MIPTVTQALERLQQNPREAAQFDACSPPGTTRREAVVATLAAFAAKRAENEAMRAKLLAARQKVAAFEKAKATNQRLRASLAASKVLLAAKQARRITAKPAAKAPTIRQQYNAITTPEGREKFRAANWDALYNSAK